MTHIRSGAFEGFFGYTDDIRHVERPDNITFEPAFDARVYILGHDISTDRNYRYMFRFGCLLQLFQGLVVEESEDFRKHPKDDTRCPHCGELLGANKSVS